MLRYSQNTHSPFTVEVAMAKRRTARLENGYKKQAPPSSKKRGVYEHQRVEYAGLDKARKKTLLQVSTILFIGATLLIVSIRFFA